MAELDIISDLKKRGLQCYNCEKYKEAEELYKTALSINKSKDSYLLGELYISLANTYYKLNDLDNYTKYYELYLQLFPEGQFAVFSRLAHAYYFIDTNKSIEYHNKALASQINDYDVSSKLFAMIKSSNYTQQEIFSEAEFEINRLKSSVYNNIKHYNHTARKYPKNKLNIGYLSSDCHTHIMMSYILPVWKNHNTSIFNFTVYNCSSKNDVTTEEINNLPNFTVVKCTDFSIEELAAKIYNDEIDILVDLSGYTHLKSFVHFYKPAPIIISYLGYLNTLGIKEVDYILADRFGIPEQVANSYTEKPLYLDCGYHVFKPGSNLPEITKSPFELNGYITFGSFNCTSKFSPAILYLWAKILESVPNSKMLIYRTKMTKNVIKRLQNKFLELGIDPQRLIFMSNSYFPHLLAYNEVDISLDTFPFSGMSICIENELMGVPVVTLLGEGLQSRGAASVNRAVGLEGLNAECGQEYVDIAANLANDRKKLKYLRKNLRNMVLESRLCKGAADFTKDLEEKYYKIWDDYISS